MGWNCGWKESCTSGSLLVTLKPCKSWDYNGMLTIYQLVQDFFHPPNLSICMNQITMFLHFFWRTQHVFHMFPAECPSFCVILPWSAMKGLWDPSSEAMTLSSVAAQLLLESTWFVSPVITCYNMLLVGGVEHLDYFPYIGNFIIPTDFHIFQRGWNHQPGYNLVFQCKPNNKPTIWGWVIQTILSFMRFRGCFILGFTIYIGIEDLRSPGYNRPLTERDAPPNRPPINIQP